MDFLKKAKASLKDLEGDLNKATQALGLGEKRQDSATAAAPAAASSQYTAAEPVSNGSTPATSNVNTPSTSVAPSTVAEQPHTKLPLAIRKLGMHFYTYRPIDIPANCVPNNSPRRLGKQAARARSPTVLPHGCSMEDLL